MDDEIKNKLAELEERIVKLEGLPKTNPGIVSKVISIKEFILQKKPKDDVQKTLVIGYYLEKYKSNFSFNAKDLEQEFRNAKEVLPTNINDKVNLNTKHGYMMEAKEKKDKKIAWTLTNSGEQIVEDNFGKVNNSVERSR